MCAWWHLASGVWHLASGTLRSVVAMHGGGKVGWRVIENESEKPKGALVEQVTYPRIYLSVCLYLSTYLSIYPSSFRVIQSLTLAARHTCIILQKKKREAGR